jgi:hypothetical protein
MTFINFSGSRSNCEVVGGRNAQRAHSASVFGRSEKYSRKPDGSQGEPLRTALFLAMSWPIVDRMLLLAGERAMRS